MAQLMPTPTVADSRNTANFKPDGTPYGNGYGTTLTDATRLLPAPTADANWGPFADAIARWERVLGRTAPAPRDAKGRLAPPFVEWMMGLPAGWVTDVPGLSRSDLLKLLGNGVVRQQGAAGLRTLLPAVPGMRQWAGAA